MNGDGGGALGHMGPQGNFSSRKVSKSSVLAKMPDLCEDYRYVKKLSSILYMMHSAHLTYPQTKEVL